jgi:hypothetical protein
MHFMRRLLRWMASVLLALACSFPAHGQLNRPGQDTSETTEERGGHTPALQYTVAILFIILVLVILCKPSRKA